MLERSEKALRLLCMALGAVLLLMVVLKVVSRSPVSGMKIPALPTLSTEADSGSGGKATNTPAGKAAEVSIGNPSTNSLVAGPTNALGTNLVSKSGSTQDVHAVHRSTQGKGGTNVVATQNAPAADTNAVMSRSHGTNVLAKSEVRSASSNTLAQAEAGGPSTNSVRSKSPGKGTNATAGVEVAMNRTNPSARPGMGPRGPELPMPIQARVDRVVDSELFGQVFRPMPSGLLGIAGNMAFLRAPTGQTGAVKEGDELGGLKLLRIGINRVLVEENGQKKELMIFEGLGGQSLLPN